MEDRVVAQAVEALKKSVHKYIVGNYMGQAVEVSGHIESSPDVLTNRTILTANFHVKKIIDNKGSAVVVDKKNVDYSESFSMTMFDSGVIIDG